MTTRARLRLLAPWCGPRVAPEELAALVEDQLGAVDALDAPQRRHGVLVQPRAPRLIYHICAGNLAISGETSLLHGLILGAQNVLKLPGDRADAGTRRELLARVEALPPSLRRLVRLQRTLDSKTFAQADVVIAFGGEAAMVELKKRARWDQKFIAHGPAASLLWLPRPEAFTETQARACARDLLAYDQLGCLSPQALYAPPPRHPGRLLDRLAAALEAEWRAQAVHPPRPLAARARIAEARDLAVALGQAQRVPTSGHLGWMLIQAPKPGFVPSPLHGILPIYFCPEGELSRALAPVAGRLSTVGFVGNLSSRSRARFLSVGATRFCPAGLMQRPPLLWHQDGRNSLAELVTWVDWESS